MAERMIRPDWASVSPPSSPPPTSMRTLRSFTATTTRTPSSFPLVPSFQASATRIE